MKLLFAPDSFKGSLSSNQINALLKQAASEIFPGCETTCIPMADGGEGTMEALIDYYQGHKCMVNVYDPLWNTIEACYGVLNDTTAIIEMAAASGLPLIKPELRNPCNTTTYGTGQLIAHALNQGCKNLILAIGGSATNDGGIGAADALGIHFLDKNGERLKPVGGNLGKIASIDSSKMLPALKEANVTIMCDVINPLIGPTGATYIYGPQKGGDADTLLHLEQGMIHYASVIKHQYGIDFSNQKSTGAAGGFSIPFLLFSNAKLSSGIETVLDTIHFEKLLENVDLVITGEGRVDQQSVYGKVLYGVGNSCKKYNIPCIAIVGSIGDGAEQIYKHGISSIMPIVNGPISLEESVANGEHLFLDAARRTLRMVRLGMNM